METKEKRIFLIKEMMSEFGIVVEDLLEKTPPKVTPKFLDIKEIKGVSCLYLRYNEEILKHEWFCLEIPNTPKMNWDEGRKWCKSKGGDYGKIPLLKFISERKDEINKILEAKGYPLIEEYYHWSTENYNYYSWILDMGNGDTYDYNKNNNYYVRAVVFTD